MGEIIIPSNLDVEVRDVTEEYRHKKFVVAVTLVEIYKYPADRFPLSVLVLEAQQKYSACPKVKFQVGGRLTIHRAAEVPKALVTCERLPLLPQSFLVPLTYRGLLTKRPRVFCSTFDIDAAWDNDDEELEVKTTMDYEADHEELASLARGDRLVVQGKELITIKSSGWHDELETLRCVRSASPTAPGAVVNLPLYVQGSFIEVVKEKRRLSLAQVVQEGPIPVNVKVVSGDPLMADDPLASSSITVQGRVDDPCLVVSREGAAGCFEIPVNRVHMKVQVMEECSTQHVLPPLMNLEKVPSYFLINLKGMENSGKKGYPPVPTKPTKNGAIGKENKQVPAIKLDGKSCRKELPKPSVPERPSAVTSPTTSKEDKGGDVGTSGEDYDDVSEQPPNSEASADSDGSYDDIGLVTKTLEFHLGRAKPESPEDAEDTNTNITLISGKKAPCK